MVMEAEIAAGQPHNQDNDDGKAMSCSTLDRPDSQLSNTSMDVGHIQNSLPAYTC